MRRQLLVLACAAALGLVACAGDPDPVAEETVEAVADTTAGTPSPTPPTPEVTSTTVPLDLPRTVVFGGLATTVREASVGNATPATVLDDDPEPGDGTWAYLDVVADWEDGYPGGSMQVEVAWYALVLADGTEVPAERVDFASAHPLREGQPASFLLAFAVDAADALDGATLRVEGTGLVPADLPLDDAVRDDDWPVALAGADAVEASIEGGCGDGLATTTLLAGEADLDGGVDHTGDRIVLNGIARATTDHVFVRLTLQTVAQSGSCGGAIVDDEQYRLVVDGLPTTPLNPHVEKLDPGSGTELVFGWLVPAEANLELMVGTVDGETASVEVLVPDLPQHDGTVR